VAGRTFREFLAPRARYRSYLPSTAAETRQREKERETERERGVRAGLLTSSDACRTRRDVSASWRGRALTRSDKDSRSRSESSARRARDMRHPGRGINASPRGRPRRNARLHSRLRHVDRRSAPRAVKPLRPPWHSEKRRCLLNESAGLRVTSMTAEGLRTRRTRA